MNWKIEDFIVPYMYVKSPFTCDDPAQQKKVSKSTKNNRTPIENQKLESLPSPFACDDPAQPILKTPVIPL